MGYPKNDTRFHTFVIGHIEDAGDHWNIHAQKGSEVVNCLKSPHEVQPKIGWRCRIYHQDGAERDCYIAGRKMFYRSAEEQRHLIRQHFTQNGLRPVARQLKNVSNQ